MTSTMTYQAQTREVPRPLERHHAPRLSIDVPLLLTIFTLLVFGAVMVYSASWDFSYSIYGDSMYMFSRQLTWMAVGVAIAFAATFIDYHYWRVMAVPVMGIVLVGLVAVLLVGEVRFNSARTLSNGSYMPSEAAKLATIIYLSIWLYSRRNQIQMVGFGILPLGGIIGIVGGLIYRQPDLSAAGTIIILGSLMFFLAGGELKQIFVLMVLTVMIGWLVVSFQPTGQSRMASYLVGIQDPSKADYHVRRSIQAFLKGGVTGVGIGKSDAKLTGLPVPPTDSIFAVVAEETGLLGVAFLIGLYLMILWRGLLIANNAPDMLGSLLAAGITFWIVIEAFINMAVMVGLIPFAGNTLPFISAGGSSLLVVLAGTGVLMSVARMTNHPKFKLERQKDALTGFSRSYRGRD